MFITSYSLFFVHCSLFFALLFFETNLSDVHVNRGDVNCSARCATSSSASSASSSSASSSASSDVALCGSDQKVYRSECELKCARVEWAKCSKCLLEKWKREKIESNENEYECNDQDGDYLMIQCHIQTSYCWCVNLFNGKPIPGTSLKNRKPNCVKFLKQLKQKRRPRRGQEQQVNKCSQHEQREFSRNLINIFQSELKRIKMLLNVTKFESIQWKFTDLDINKDLKLSRKELIHFKRMIIKIIRPTKCAHHFLRNCDLNKDKLIQFNEWKHCLHSQQQQQQQHSAAASAITATTTMKLSAQQPQNQQQQQQQREKKPRRKQTTLDLVLMLSNSGAGTGVGGGIPFLFPTRNKDESNDDDEGDDLIVDDKSKGIVLSENCSLSRKNGFERSSSSSPASASIFIPECQQTNAMLYNEVQCHQATRYCWCVNVKNGHPIPHTSTANLQKPNCKQVQSSKSAAATASSSSAPVKGCLFRKKQRFVRELIYLFENEMKANASSSSVNDAGGSSNLAIIKWKFNQLDLNGNSKLERSEVKQFKQFVAQLKQMKNLRKCWRNFFRFCDFDSNQSLDENEFVQCCGEYNDYAQQQQQQQQQYQQQQYSSQQQRNSGDAAQRRRTNPFTNKRRGPNPFSTILKAD